MSDEQARVKVKLNAGLISLASAIICGVALYTGKASWVEVCSAWGFVTLLAVIFV